MSTNESNKHAGSKKKVISNRTPLDKQEVGDIIDRMICGGLMHLYPIDPLFDVPDNIPLKSSNKDIKNKGLRNKEIVGSAYDALQKNPYFNKLKEVTDERPVQFKLFFHPTNVPKPIAYFLLNIVNNGFNKPGVGDKDYKCEYSSIIEASKTINAPILLNSSWIEWLSKPVNIIGKAKQCNADIKARQEISNNGNLFDISVLLTIINLLPIKLDDKFSIIGHELNIPNFTKNQFDFLVPHGFTSAENIKLVEYYKLFTSSMRDMSIYTPPLQYFNVDAKEIQKSNSSTFGAGCPIILWILLGLTIFPENPILISYFKNMKSAEFVLPITGTPEKATSTTKDVKNGGANKTVNNIITLTISDIEEKIGKTSEQYNLLHHYILQTASKEIFAIFNMLYTSLVENKTIPENFGMIDKSGNLQGTNIKLHRKESAGENKPVDEITIEKVQQAIITLQKNPDDQDAKDIFNAYLYGDNAVYSETIGQTTTKKFMQKAKTTENITYTTYEPLFKIDSFLTPCEDDDGSKKCAPLHSKNQFEFMLCLMRLSYMIKLQISKSYANHTIQKLEDFVKNMESNCVLYLETFKQSMSKKSEPAKADSAKAESTEGQNVFSVFQKPVQTLSDENINPPPYHVPYKMDSGGSMEPPIPFVLPVSVNKQYVNLEFQVKVKQPSADVSKKIKDLPAQEKKIENIVKMLSNENIIQFIPGNQSLDDFTLDDIFELFASRMMVKDKYEKGAAPAVVAKAKGNVEQLQKSAKQLPATSETTAIKTKLEEKKKTLDARSQQLSQKGGVKPKIDVEKQEKIKSILETTPKTNDEERLQLMFKRFFYDYNNTIAVAKDELKESFKTQFSKMKGGTDDREAAGTSATVATPTAAIKAEVDTGLQKQQKGAPLPLSKDKKKDASPPPAVDKQKDTPQPPAADKKKNTPPPAVDKQKGSPQPPAADKKKDTPPPAKIQQAITVTRMGSKPIPVATATNVSAAKLSSSSATSQVKSEVVQDIKPDKVIGNANDFIYDLKELVKIHVDKFLVSVVENKENSLPRFKSQSILYTNFLTESKTKELFNLNYYSTTNPQTEKVVETKLGEVWNLSSIKALFNQNKKSKEDVTTIKTNLELPVKKLFKLYWEYFMGQEIFNLILQSVALLSTLNKSEIAGLELTTLTSETKEQDKKKNIQLILFAFKNRFLHLTELEKDSTKISKYIEHISNAIDIITEKTTTPTYMSIIETQYIKEVTDKDRLTYFPSAVSYKLLQAINHLLGEETKASDMASAPTKESAAKSRSVKRSKQETMKEPGIKQNKTTKFLECDTSGGIFEESNKSPLIIGGLSNEKASTKYESVYLKALVNAISDMIKNLQVQHDKPLSDFKDGKAIIGVDKIKSKACSVNILAFLLDNIDMPEDKREIISSYILDNDSDKEQLFKSVKNKSLLNNHLLMILLFGLPIYNVNVPKTINKTTPVTVTRSDTNSFFRNVIQKKYKYTPAKVLNEKDILTDVVLTSDEQKNVKDSVERLNKMISSFTRKYNEYFTKGETEKMDKYKTEFKRIAFEQVFKWDNLKRYLKINPDESELVNTIIKANNPSSSTPIDKSKMGQYESKIKANINIFNGNLSSYEGINDLKFKLLSDVLSPLNWSFNESSDDQDKFSYKKELSEVAPETKPLSKPVTFNQIIDTIRNLRIKAFQNSGLNVIPDDSPPPPPYSKKSNDPVDSALESAPNATTHTPGAKKPDSSKSDKPAPGAKKSDSSKSDKPAPGAKKSDSSKSNKPAPGAKKSDSSKKTPEKEKSKLSMTDFKKNKFEPTNPDTMKGGGKKKSFKNRKVTVIPGNKTRRNYN